MPSPQRNEHGCVGARVGLGCVASATGVTRNADSNGDDLAVLFDFFFVKVDSARQQRNRA